MGNGFKKFMVMGMVASSQAFSAEIGNEVMPVSFETYVPMHAYNLIPSEKSENLQWALGRAKKLAATIDLATLPPKVDFSNLLPAIHSQGNLGSCTGQAMTAAMEINLAKKNAYTMLSPLFVYYNERKLIGTINEDSGASLADGIRAICTWGSCKEPTWKYNDDEIRFKIKPSQAAYKEGVQFLGLDSIVESQVPHTLTAIKAVLAKETPIVFGVFVYPSFERCPGGKVPMPDQFDYPLGGHALTFVGYNDETQEFKFANSWGKNWGDNGYGYLKYDYVMNKSATNNYERYFFANDIWSVDKVGQDQTSEDSPRGA